MKMTILEKIKANAHAFPNRMAIISNILPPPSEFSDNLTWGELDLFSDKLAAYLNRSLRTKTPVIVYGHKNPYMLVCFLACVKSGRAYCPIDISVPISRVEAIIQEVHPEIILATCQHSIAYSPILDLDSIRSIISTETQIISTDCFVSADDVFYIIFTSGSTGVPKGVQITRDCLDHFIEWAVTLGNQAPGDSSDIYLNQAPFSFDLSVMDLYLSLYKGGTLWTLSKELQGNTRELLQSFSASNANVWVSTPSFADVCLADKNFNDVLLPHLHTFLFCGETLTNRTAERLQKAFPKAAIVNTYGPTESTVAVTDVLISPEINETFNPLPVGTPKPGTWIFIMDESGNILPDEIKGEIVIVGNSVSIGYFNRPALTGKAFGTYTVNGTSYRLYHTGDKGYMSNGQLFYCGRIDLQIKLHGYRIEIEDIESNLMKLEHIMKAAVMPKYHGNQVKSLTAYIVSKTPVTDEFREGQEIRAQLRNYLPDYMIPKKILFLDQLPMTNNGKVDRKALGEIEK